MRSIASNLLLLGLAAITSSAWSAESVDAAVDQIAKRFVESRTGSGQSIRIAVTAFSQADRRTTELTNLVMIALTSEMIAAGTDTFRVIERARLGAALREIERQQVPIFDRDTAKKLGNFLNVDALVVGEITPLLDRVRIDARLVDIATIETLSQADVWIPLTASVQSQLDKDWVAVQQVVSDKDGIDKRAGVWDGTGQCGDSKFGLAVTLVPVGAGELTAMQTYYPLNPRGEGGLKPGVLTMQGTIDSETGKFKLNPARWLFQPPGHSALGFEGVLDANREEIVAQYTLEGCSEVRLRKTR